MTITNQYSKGNSYSLTRTFTISRPHQTPTPTESPKTPRSPVIPRCPTPHHDSVSSSDSTDSDSDSTMTITTKDLVDALTTTLKNINQSPTIPLPVFKGKKGEDPDDHILKVETYFEIHEIKRDKAKIKRFKDSLFEAARKWVQTLNYTDITQYNYDPKVPEETKKSIKYQFVLRFARKGRTLKAAYNTWSTLTFDPNKDDIEQVVSKVEELAKKLGYNEDAQVMAVKSVLPRDVYGICMTYKTLKELKSFLIDLFSNPKMTEAVPGSASVPTNPSVFSIGQHMENSVVNLTAVDLGKIQQDMNAMQVRFHKISTADPRNRSNNKPWKPEVTPQEGEEDSIGVEVADNLTICSIMTDLKISIMIIVKMETMVREMGMVLLRIEDKVEEISEIHSMVEVEDKVGLIKVQMSDAQE